MLTDAPLPLAGTRPRWLAWWQDSDVAAQADAPLAAQETAATAGGGGAPAWLAQLVRARGGGEWRVGVGNMGTVQARTLLQPCSSEEPLGWNLETFIP